MSALPPPPVSLSSLSPGKRCTVVRIEGNGGIDRRLLDLGFVPDTPVRVVRRAPLGDPISYELRGFEICLRESEASRVWVRADST
jgi:Fe2+ transport system protein FeoA